MNEAVMVFINTSRETFIVFHFFFFYPTLEDLFLLQDIEQALLWNFKKLSHSVRVILRIA